jgi:hypothetical protein
LNKRTSSVREPFKLKKKLYKKQLNDDEFIARYLELDENGSALAKEMGGARSTVSMRLKRIGQEKLEQARKNGVAAVMVARALKSVNTPQSSMLTSFEKGTSEAVETLNIFAGLEELALQIKPMLTDIRDDIAVRGKKAKPFEIDQVCKLSARLESLIINAHKMKIEMLKDEGTKAFMRSMLEIYLEEVPDVRDRLYHKLSRYGLEGQVSVVGS